MKWFSLKKSKEIREKAVKRKKKFYVYYFSKRDNINYYLNITQTDIGRRFFWTISTRDATVFYDKFEALEIIKSLSFKPSDYYLDDKHAIKYNIMEK